MKHIYNFGAGPAKIPKEVLQKAHEEFFNWQNTGISILEIGHRTEDYMHFAQQTEKNLRTLLSIPAEYKVLFFSGGATSQFAMVPLNLCNKNTIADYLITGIWSEKAQIEAQKYCRSNIVASNKNNNYIDIPHVSTWQIHDNAAYFYYCANETISGVEFFDIPTINHAPLVSDMSSILFTAPLDVTKFGCIFACAQKNFGSAGITLVIIREDLLGHAHPLTPSLYDYKKNADSYSMFNTPPVFSWYMASLCFSWMLKEGGLSVLHNRSQQKAKLLYDAIDNSDFYVNHTSTSCRSRTNIPFFLRNATLETTFLTQVKQAGLLNLKGHRLNGGIRASIYNALPLAGVETLVDFMNDFANQYA